MRNKQSQFNAVCDFVNNISVGQTFTTQEYLSEIGHYENLTSWKRNSGNHYYICHQYKGYLRRGGFIKNIKRGTWEVQKHIPGWFDLGHLQYLLGYKRWSNSTGSLVQTYKGLSREDIRNKLNHTEGSIMPQQMVSISQNASPSNVTTGTLKLPKLAKVNQDAYNQFLEITKKTGKVFYNTQASLYAALEKIKFPYVRNNETQNRYSGNNYDNIIAHLTKDGYLTYLGRDKNRKQFRVNIDIKQNVNNISDEFVTNSTSEYKTENNSIMKTAAIQKIDHKESEFFNEPTLSTGNEKMDIAVNVGVLESAQAVLSQFTSNDTFMRARVYNVMAQLEHISKELQEKSNLI